jgi:hypothetical protein
VGCQHCWAKEREKGEGTGLRRETKKRATKEREPRLARFYYKTCSSPYLLKTAQTNFEFKDGERERGKQLQALPKY